jgi:hypothetical protein
LNEPLQGKITSKAHLKMAKQPATTVDLRDPASLLPYPAIYIRL